MNVSAKLSAYGAALAVAVAGAFATGSAVGPLTTLATADAAGHGAPGAGSAGHGDTHGGTVPETADQPAGLASSRGGYTLTPTDPTLTPTTPDTFSFAITGPDGAPVTAFDVEHDKRMHLIVVRRDTTDFQHVHPEMAPDGTWSVPFTAASAGSYRAFADSPPPAARPPPSASTSPRPACSSRSRTPRAAPRRSTATPSSCPATWSPVRHLRSR